MNIQDKVEGILDEVWEFLIDKLDENGIKYDSGSCDGAIFYNDEKQKKTFAINLYQNQCEEYEGD